MLLPRAERSVGRLEQKFHAFPLWGDTIGHLYQAVSMEIMCTLLLQQNVSALFCTLPPDDKLFLQSVAEKTGKNVAHNKGWSPLRMLLDGVQQLCELYGWRGGSCFKFLESKISFCFFVLKSSDRSNLTLHRKVILRPPPPPANAFSRTQCPLACCKVEGIQKPCTSAV